jgi:hypothetical protein
MVATQLGLLDRRETAPLFPRKLCDGAGFSPDRRHRYWLSRTIPQRKTWTHAFLWLMLNPSIADETQLDPTLRRCMAFTKEWGGTQMLVGNLFSLVSTDPAGLAKNSAPVGPLCNQNLEAMVEWACGRVVVGWGACPHAKARAREVMERFPHVAFSCLGTNVYGSPRHPLYLPSTAQLVLWEG